METGSKYFVSKSLDIIVRGANLIHTWMLGFKSSIQSSSEHLPFPIGQHFKLENCYVPVDMITEYLISSSSYIWVMGKQIWLVNFYCIDLFLFIIKDFLGQKQCCVAFHENEKAIQWVYGWCYLKKTLQYGSHIQVHNKCSRGCSRIQHNQSSTR